MIYKYKNGFNNNCHQMNNQSKMFLRQRQNYTTIIFGTAFFFKRNGKYGPKLLLWNKDYKVKFRSESLSAISRQSSLFLSQLCLVVKNVNTNGTGSSKHSSYFHRNLFKHQVKFTQFSQHLVYLRWSLEAFLYWQSLCLRPMPRSEEIDNDTVEQSAKAHSLILPPKFLYLEWIESSNVTWKTSLFPMRNIWNQSRWRRAKVTP